MLDQYRAKLLELIEMGILISPDHCVNLKRRKKIKRYLSIFLFLDEKRIQKSIFSAEYKSKYTSSSSNRKRASAFSQSAKTNDAHSWALRKKEDPALFIYLFRSLLLAAHRRYSLMFHMLRTGIIGSLRERDNRTDKTTFALSRSFSVAHGVYERIAQWRREAQRGKAKRSGVEWNPVRLAARRDIA